MSGPSVQDLNAVNDPLLRALLGAMRRMTVKVSSSSLWQVLGYKIAGKTETLQAEPFTGIGFYSRPPASGKPEAIALFVGGAKSPAVVALRDEKTRVRMAGNLANGETAVFSDGTIVHLRAGTIEIRLGSAPLVESTIKADTYRAAEDTLLTAIQAWAAAVGAAFLTIPTFVDPGKTAFASATTALNTAIAAFKAAGAAYKTTVLKVQ